eukprot:5267844-Prymnesium_polylepis.1
MDEAQRKQAFPAMRLIRRITTPRMHLLTHGLVIDMGPPPPPPKATGSGVVMGPEAERWWLPLRCESSPCAKPVIEFETLMSVHQVPNLGESIHQYFDRTNGSAEVKVV